MSPSSSRLTCRIVAGAAAALILTGCSSSPDKLDQVYDALDQQLDWRDDDGRSDFVDLQMITLCAEVKNLPTHLHSVPTGPFGKLSQEDVFKLVAGELMADQAETYELTFEEGGVFMEVVTSTHCPDAHADYFERLSVGGFDDPQLIQDIVGLISEWPEATIQRALEQRYAEPNQ